MEESATPRAQTFRRKEPSAEALLGLPVEEVEVIHREEDLARISDVERRVDRTRRCIAKPSGSQVGKL